MQLIHAHPWRTLVLEVINVVIWLIVFAAIFLVLLGALVGSQLDRSNSAALCRRIARERRERTPWR